MLSERDPLISPEATALSDEALCREIAKIIAENEKPLTDHQPDHDNKKKLAVTALMHSLRFGSTDYRYRSDLDTFQQIVKVSFIHLEDSKIAAGIFEVSSIIFWFTDGFNTFLTTRDAVYDVCMHPDWSQGLFNFKGKIVNKKYPPILSMMSIPGMVGAGFQGYAGTYFTLMRFSSLFFDEIPDALSIVYIGLSVLVALGTAFNFFVYQIDRKAMSFIRILTALKNSPYMAEYKKRNFYKLLRHHAAGIALATAWTLLTAEAIFFINDSFELTPLNTSIFIPILVGNIPLRIFIISYNYLFSSIKDQYPLQSTDSIVEVVRVDNVDLQTQPSNHHCIELVKLLCKISAFIGSLGTVIALAGPVFRAVMLTFGYKKISDESNAAVITAFAISLVLACLSYGRDIKLWGTAGDTLFKEKPRSAVIPNQEAIGDQFANTKPTS